MDHDLNSKEAASTIKRTHRHSQDLYPERYYGKNNNVLLCRHPSFEPDHMNSCRISRIDITDGIILIFHDIHSDTLDYGEHIPEFSTDLICIQHCKQGRFEACYNDGEYLYLGPGHCTVNFPSCSPVTNSFPLGHYYGFYVAIQPQVALRSLTCLEQILGPLNIDLTTFSKQVSSTNKVAFYPLDDALAGLTESLYILYENHKESALKLRVLELLQCLCGKQVMQPKEKHYFTVNQITTVKKIHQYLISHVDEQIPLQQIASRFCISLTSLKIVFKEVYGQPVAAYMREYRLQKAAELLLKTEMKIIDIAGSVGYDNASRFSQAFLRYFGALPRDYRKSVCLSGRFPDRNE